jgi:hypothetical protein
MSKLPSVVLEISYQANIKCGQAARSFVINGVMVTTTVALESIRKAISLSIILPAGPLYPGLRINSRDLEGSIRVIADSEFEHYLTENGYLEIGDVSLLKYLINADVSLSVDTLENMMIDMNDVGYSNFDEMHDWVKCAFYMEPGAAKYLIEMKTSQNEYCEAQLNVGSYDAEAFKTFQDDLDFRRLASLSLDDARIFLESAIPIKFLGLTEISEDLAELLCNNKGLSTVRLPKNISSGACAKLINRKYPLTILVDCGMDKSLLKMFQHCQGEGIQVHLEVDGSSIGYIPVKLKVCAELDDRSETPQGTNYYLRPNDSISIAEVREIIKRGDFVSVVVGESLCDKLLIAFEESQGPIAIEFTAPLNLSNEQIDKLCSKTGYLIVGPLAHISFYLARKLSERSGETVITGEIQSITQATASLIAKHKNIRFRSRTAADVIHKVVIGELKGTNIVGGDRAADEARRIRERIRDYGPDDMDPFDVPF